MQYILLRLLRVGSLEARADAALQLGSDGYAHNADTQVIPALIDALMPRDDDEWHEVPEAARAALAQIGKRAVPQVTHALRYADAMVRGYAALVLGDIGDRNAVPDLVSALSDENIGVRAFVADALGRVGGKRAIDALVEFEDRERVLVRRGGPVDAVNAAVDALVALGYYEDSEPV